MEKEEERKRSPSENHLPSVKDVNCCNNSNNINNNSNDNNHNSNHKNNLDAQIDPNRPSNCGVTRAQ